MKIQSNKEQQTLLQKVKNNEIIYSQLPILYQTEDFIEHALNVNIDFFDTLPLDMKNDINFISSILDQTRQDHYVHILKYVDSEITNDPKVMINLCKICTQSCVYLSERLKNDKEYIKQLLKSNSLCFKYISSAFQDDKDLAKIVVDDEVGNMLKYAGPTVQNDKDLVLKAVQSFGSVLKDLPDHYKKDATICLHAIEQSPMFYETIDDTLKHDQSFILQCIQTIAPFKIGYFFKWLDNDFLDDKDFVKKMVNINRYSD